MANASAKRISAQNEAAIRTLKLGTVATILIALVLRLLLKRLSRLGLITSSAAILPALLLAQFLIKSGTPRRDPSGVLISAGEDLSQAGLLEWCWDIIYVTWACQIGSAAFGERVWWLYLSIPFYALYKILNIFSSFGKRGNHVGVEETPLAESKRQEKLRKRGKKGQ